LVEKVWEAVNEDMSQRYMVLSLEARGVMRLNTTKLITTRHIDVQKLAHRCCISIRAVQFC